MDMHDTLRKIRALHSLNVEIVERVESQEVKTVFRYTMDLDQNNRSTIVEKEETVSVKTMLSEWRMGESGKEFERHLIAFTGEMDNQFMESHNYTWEELKILNTKMIASVEHLARILDDRKPEALGELRKYQSNLEILQVAFGSVEELTMSETSQIVELSEKAAAANKILDELSSQLVSTILTSEQWAILRGWYGSSSQLWSLLYRGTRDGMLVSDFHRLCDNQGRTVVVIKSSGGFVFGGYAAKSWSPNKGSSFISCNDSSLFTLRNPHGIEPTIFKKAHTTNQHALEYQTSCGPTFGGGHDLYTGSGTIGQGAYTILGFSYLDTTGKGAVLFTGKKEFQIQEIEVYKV